MRQLLILRHAKSSWDDAAQPDRDRPLNARGRRTGAIMRQAMNDLHLAPDVVLVFHRPTDAGNTGGVGALGRRAACRANGQICTSPTRSS